MRSRRVLLLFLALTALPLAAGRLAPVPAADEDTKLDYRYFKSTISPMLRRLCGECHADPRKRKKMGRFFLRPAPGRRMRERFEERNFDTVRAFIEAEDPSASVILLKALGPARGGITHEGGAILANNMAEYGQLIDFINGKREAVEAFVPPASAEGQPDFLFFYKRIEPVLLGVCAECHEGRGKGRFKLVVHERGEDFPIEDHYANFQTVLKLLRPGQPEKSRFLLKPLALDDGGLKHKGGDRIRKGTPNHENWLGFINGQKGPPLPVDGERRVPVLTAEGLTIQAEDFELEGGAVDVERDGAEEFYVATVEVEDDGGEDGRIWTDLRVADAGAYQLTFRVAPGAKPLRWGFQGGTARTLRPPGEADRDEHGFGRTGPEHLLDHDAPLVDARGGLALRDGVLHLDGRREDAAFLSPSTVRNEGVSAKVTMAHDEEGGDDVLLLFDVDDGWNGKLVGLTDGGRRFVMGVLEGGKVRVLEAVKAPDPEPAERGKPRELKVEYFGGIAVGSLDGQPLAFLNLNEQIGRGRPFGILTHGLAAVHAVAALEEYEVYAMEFGVGPIVDLPAGPLRLWIEIPAGGGAVDSVRFSVPDGN